VALLGLCIPSLQSSKEEGIRIAAHSSGVRRRVQRTEPEHEAVVGGVQAMLRVLDGVLRSTLELRAKRRASSIANHKQLFHSRHLCGG
jgi:hypothetical protein